MTVGTVATTKANVFFKSNYFYCLMASCDDCRLPVERPLSTPKTRILCDPCLSLHNFDSSTRIRPIERDDLELLLAWRSNINIYRHFRAQNEPLEWEEHVTWYESRPDSRYDFLIQYDGRRVGVVSISSDDEVGIYLGDLSAHGHGLATAALEWICDRFENRIPLTAEVHKNNEPSKRLFKRCGFKKSDTERDWILYIYEP